MAVLKRQLHLWHRWLGMVLGLLVLLWFGSGTVMMYVPYPSLTDAERQRWLAPIDAAAVRIDAWEAWQATGQPGVPAGVRLNSVGGRPAYHFQPAVAGGTYGLVSVWADTGIVLEVSDALAIDSARAASATGAPVEAIERIELDQWTFGRVSVHRPLHRVSVADEAGSVHYVSGRTGELVRDTTRSERAWNWAGSVIHWLYFKPLREKAEPWRQAVMWTSGIAFALALSGMVLGIQRLRLRRRYKDGRRSPYRGWQAWHHWLGLAAGTLTLTWLFSGWLSVTPFGWLKSPGITVQDRLAFAGGPLTRADLALPVDAALRLNPGALELEWRRVGSETYLAVLEKGGRRLLDASSGAGAHLQPAQLRQAAQALRPAMPLLAVDALAGEDDYYYSHHSERAFPVLRVRFDAADGGTYYIDPQRGQLAGYADNNSRWRRWLFNGLHQFDFVRARPAWDTVVVMLSLCGALLAVTGIVLGAKRLRRKWPLSTG